MQEGGYVVLTVRYYTMQSGYREQYVFDIYAVILLCHPQIGPHRTQRTIRGHTKIHGVQGVKASSDKFSSREMAVMYQVSYSAD